MRVPQPSPLGIYSQTQLIFLCVGYENKIKIEQNVVKLDTTCKCFVGKLKLLSGSLN